MIYGGPSEFVGRHIHTLTQLKTDRHHWEQQWEDVARLIWPQMSRKFIQNVRDLQPGQKLNEVQYDANASLALERFGAVMESLLTPRSSTWHGIEATNSDLMKLREVKLWFEEATRALFRYRYRTEANFSNNMQDVYQSHGAFGTGALFVDEMVGGGMRYRADHLGEIFVMTNHQNIVDVVYRRFMLDAQQAGRRWGDKLPEKIAKDAIHNPTQRYEFVHVVAPRGDYDPDAFDERGMQYESHYMTIEGHALLKSGGYHTFPYCVSRYTTTAGERYGRGPAMKVLPAIKTLNEEKYTVLRQGQRTVDPILLAHDDGLADTFSMRSGALNGGALTKDGKRLVDVLPTGNLAVGFEMMQQEKAIIDDAFLVTLFQILVDGPQKTATEVMELAREKGMLLSPTAGRQETELLGPMIERELDILQRQGALPPMPAVLEEAGGDYDIVYTSPLARAQKAEEAVGLFRYMEFAANHQNLTGSPAAMDHIDIDAAAPEVLDINAVPERWRASAEQLEATRESRAEAQKRREELEAAPAQAGMIKAQ